MENIGKAADKAINHLTTPPSRNASVPAVRRVSFTADNLPLGFDHHTDIALPAKLWSNWQETGKPRTIRRELASEERDALDRRATSLDAALQPSKGIANEQDRIAVALANLMESFKDAATGDNAIARIKSMMEVLDDLPAWAIEQTCASMRKRGYEIVDADGRRRIEQTWAPKGPQLHAAVEKVIEQRGSALASARALLAAPVEPKPIEVVGRPVDDVIAEFKQAISPNADAIEQAENVRRSAILDASRKRNLEDRRREYRAAGLAVPPGESFTSLSMMLHNGWTIGEIAGGGRVLISPRKASA